MHKRIEKCRICGNTRLERVLDLGNQTLTGVFPRRKYSKTTIGPLCLVKCHGSDHDNVCGLLQLEHSYDLAELYGENYGYRSGLNPSMVAHLHKKVATILERVELCSDDLVVDIGSNDSTTLQAYPHVGAKLVGFDPTGVKFKKYYPPHIQLVSDFFSSAKLKNLFPRQKAKIVTSFSMFYDLEDPIAFMREIYEVLSHDGIWVFEQSYMPTMIKMNSYDTVCHEHLEFYALQQIKWMTDRTGFTILDVEFNDVNGGSFSVTVAKSGTDINPSSSVSAAIEMERNMELNNINIYKDFKASAEKSKKDLLDFIRTVRKAGKKVAALGASTKGNVLLQYCGLTEDDIFAVGEVNSDKFGCFTPGTNIPIIPEDKLLALSPDYLLVLPWHFRQFFEKNPKFSGIKLVFPLPKLEIC